jgi:hypothetical protein
MSSDIKTNAHSILEKTALNMLKQKIDDKLIVSVTGFSLEEIAKLKNKLSLKIYNLLKVL